ncbi:MAG: STAS domain-containing protein [Magnetococcales bacterium]|nr:STAS domain-containing protein [Magnetococcales bacterium]
MTISVLKNEDVVTITLDSRFVFSEHRDFRETYKEQPPGSRYVLDFRRVTYMDSAALGMLLLLNEHNGPGGTDLIKMINCNPQVAKVFEIANFSRLFSID